MTATPPKTTRIVRPVIRSMLSFRKMREKRAARNGAVARISRQLATEVYCSEVRKKIDPVPCSAIMPSAAGVKRARNPGQAEGRNSATKASVVMAPASPRQKATVIASAPIMRTTRASGKKKATPMKVTIRP